MIKNINSMNYLDYLNTANEEEMVFIDELNKQGEIFSTGTNKIKAISKRTDILVVTSTACKDSATIMPFLMKLSELNNNINVRLLRKDQNESLLQELTGENKVPTIVILEGNTVIRKFVEFPKGVKDILISSSIDKTQGIIDDMRDGKYNELIQDDLIKFITGEDYNYISFDRKDK